MYQSVYEGDVRFEHCYRVDEERNVAATEKLQCWRDWSQGFYYGQSRDRVSYALGRQRTLAQALAAGQPADPPGAADAAKPALPRMKSIYASSPPTFAPASLDTSAASSTLLTARDTASSDAGAAAPAASLAASNLATVKIEPSAALADAPGASCAGACARTWSNCKQPCRAGACRMACDDQYRGCMKACF